MFHKKVLSLLFIFFMLITIGAIVPENADSRLLTNVPSDISGNELKALVIEDFENAQVGDNGWLVKSEPRKFEKAETEKKLKMKDPVPTLDMKIVDGSPNAMSTEEWSLTDKGKKKEKCLGVYFKFRYPGTNSVHILAPPEVDWKRGTPVKTYNPSTRQDEQERGVQLPGRAKGISLWVHGRGHPYFLEAWVKDYRGNTHILKFGSVNFVGWRPMKVTIPGSIPQSFESFPQTRVTKITRFVLRADEKSHRQELTVDTFFAFDQLKVLTDIYEVNFDGKDLDRAFTGESKQQSQSKTQSE